MPIGAFKLNGIGRYLAPSGPVTTARANPAILGTPSAATFSATGGAFSGYVEWDQDEYFNVTVDPSDTTWYYDANKAWTIEFWWMRTSTLSSTDSSYWTLDGISHNAFGMRTDTATPNNFKFTVASAVVYTGAIPTSLQHFAIVSTGSNTIQLFMNGSRVYTGSYTRTDNLRKFLWTVPGFGATPKLRFDEMRISNSARYSGTTYTVPTAAFTNDANTLGLFHFDSSTIVDDFTPTTTVSPTYGVKIGTNSPATAARYADTNGITETITASHAGITFAAWVKPTLANHNATNGWVLVSLGQSDGNSAIYITLRDDGGIRFYRQYVTGFQDLNPLVSGANSGISTANQWYHIAISATTNATPEVYVNGVAKTVTGGSINANNFRFDVATTVYIGGTNFQLNDGYGDSITQVYLDNAAISLSTNISKFYNNGYVNLGPNGTNTGLTQPLMFHDGNTTTGFNENSFTTRGGRTTGVYMTYNILDNDAGTIANA